MKRTTTGAIEAARAVVDGANRPDVPTSSPARVPWDAAAIRARLEVEATNLSAELDAETAKKSPTPYLVGRLRGLLVKVLRQLGQSTPATPPAKPKPTFASLGVDDA